MPAPRRNRYRFETRWQIDASPDEIFQVLTDHEHLSEWWPSVYRRVETRARGGPDGVGRILSLETQGWLPYRLRWNLRVVGCRRPESLSLVAWGDLDAIRARIQAHLDAGADHVCIQPFDPAGGGRPDMALLEQLAPDA